MEKKLVLDVHEWNKIAFLGKEGDKVNYKIAGKFSGKVEFAMISSSNNLTDKNFAVFKDSIDINIGTLNIYQNSAGFTLYLRPVDTPSGSVVVSMTEYRNE